MTKTKTKDSSITWRNTTGFNTTTSKMENRGMTKPRILASNLQGYRLIDYTIKGPKGPHPQNSTGPGD